MPSIQDVADQINAKLDQVTTNTASTKLAVDTVDATLQTGFADVRTDLQAIDDRVAAVDATLQAGFTNLGAGLYAVLEVQRSALAELAHQSEQNATIICLIENTNDLLCSMTQTLAGQLRIAEDSNVAIKRIDGIAERVHCDAAADYARVLQMRAELEACCPPEPPRPEPCPEACEVPKYKRRKPDGQDWSPIPPRKKG